MTKRELKLIQDALLDAAAWQDSISDVHHSSLLPCYRSRKNTAAARRADKQRGRYLALYNRIAKESV